MTRANSSAGSFRRLFFAASMLLTLVMGTNPAAANNLWSGTIAADCSGYAVTVKVISLNPTTAYTADYTVQTIA